MKTKPIINLSKVIDLEPIPQDQSLPATEFTAYSTANPKKAAKKDKR